MSYDPGATRKALKRRPRAPTPYVKPDAAEFSTLAFEQPYLFAWLLLPIKTIGEGNARENPARRHARSLEHRQCTAHALRSFGDASWRVNVQRVSFTRLAPNALDSDNLAGSFKYVRDQIAAWLAGHQDTHAWDAKRKKIVSTKGDDSPRGQVQHWEPFEIKSPDYGCLVRLYRA